MLILNFTEVLDDLQIVYGIGLSTIPFERRLIRNTGVPTPINIAANTKASLFSTAFKIIS